MTAPRPKPATSSRAARLNAGTLLNAQAVARRQLQAAIAASIQAAVADAARRQHDDRARKAAILALLLLASKRMAEQAKAAIVEGRRHARREGARRLATELVALGVTLKTGSWPMGFAAGVIVNGWQHRGHEDDLHATTAADALAVAWRAAAFRAASVALREDRDVAGAIQGTAAAMTPRAERTSDTEIAGAYSEERRLSLVDASTADPEFRDVVTRLRLVRRWVAMLDACPLCWPLDGELAVDGRFDGGAEPGFMHPRCRCTDELVVASAEDIADAA